MKNKMKNKKILKEIEENFVFGKVYSFNKNGLAHVTFQNCEGEINHIGKLIHKFDNRIKFCFQVDDNVFLFKTYKYWGCMKKDGNIIIPPIYETLGGIFKQKYLQVKKDSRCGLIDINNTKIINMKYDFLDVTYIDQYGKEFFIVEKMGKYGVIDINEKEIIPLKYDNLEMIYTKDNRFYATLGRKKGIINLKNEIIIPFEYSDIYYLGQNSIMATKDEEKFIIINEQNKQICKTVFEEIEEYTNFNNSPILYPAKLNNKWGFIDELGKIVIDFKYTSTYIVPNGEKYASVSLSKDIYGDTFGIIDMHENQILPFEYQADGFKYIDKNRFIVRKDEKYGIVDKNNNVVVDFIFDDISLPYTDKIKYYCAKINGKYGFIDKNGNPLKIDKESLKIPETILNVEKLSLVEQIKYLFT